MKTKIKGFENYTINDRGVIWNNKGTKLKLQINKDGYQVIHLYKDGKRKYKRVCRLVAENFIPNPNQLPVVNHINSVRDDDRVENLEWSTTLDNNLHGIANNPDLHRGNASINKEEAETICKLLEIGLRVKDISNLLNISKELIYHISKGVTWKELSSNYTFPPRKSRMSDKTVSWLVTKVSEGLDNTSILSLTDNPRITTKMIDMIREENLYKEFLN